MPVDEWTKLAARIARNLVHYRRQRRLRQEDMEQFGIPYKRYQALERPRNRSANITLRTLAKLAKALRVPASKLLK